MIRRPPSSTLFPFPAPFRSVSQTVQITASAQNWTGTTAQITVDNPVLNLRNVLTPRTTASASQEIWADITNPSCGCGDFVNAPVRSPVTHYSPIVSFASTPV